MVKVTFQYLISDLYPEDEDDLFQVDWSSPYVKRDNGVPVNARTHFISSSSSSWQWAGTEVVQ